MQMSILFSVTRRQGMIHCLRCKKWYHAKCFPMPFEYSLKEVFSICRTCLTEMYHENLTHFLCNQQHHL